MRAILALLLALLLAVPAVAQVRVFAASSLTEALTDVADAYAKTGKPRPTLVFGASSALARQIAAGAPASIFISADAAWMDQLAQARRIVFGSRRDLLANRLVLIVPADAATTTLAIGKGFDFAALIGDGKWTTGDPDAVPAGRYARAALTSLGVWDSVERHLARAENVRAALALVETGAAAAGIVYATDARASEDVAVAGVFPASSHPPIVYPAALTVLAPDTAARDFFAYLGSPTAKAIYRKRGFGVK